MSELVTASRADRTRFSLHPEREMVEVTRHRRQIEYLDLREGTTARCGEAELPYLRNEISAFARFWVSSVYGEQMVRTASPERMVHLRQAMEHEGHLAEEVRKARATMKEPARG